MEEDNQIGLSELITKIRNELLTANSDEDVPFFAVSEVELEFQMKVSREGRGGVKIYVLEAGAGSTRDKSQTVKITLSPLLKKEVLLAIYKKRYPKKYAKLLGISVDALTLGGDDSTVSDQFD